VTAIAPKLHSSSLIDHYRPIWAGYYSAIEKIIGNGGVIIPLLDPDHVASATTMTTRTHHTDGPSAEITGTWSEAPTAFDTPADLSDIEKYQGCIPFVHLNGTDERLDVADDDYLTHGDASNDEAFSMGVWFNLDAAVAGYYLFNKGISNGENEYHVILPGGTTILWRFEDESTGQRPKVQVDGSVLSTGRWHFLVVTYDGTGGGSATAAGMEVYLDGVLQTVTRTEAGSYTAMEPGNESLAIGGVSSQQHVDGKIAGGPISPFHSLKELNAQEVYRLYLLGAAAMGLQ